MFILTNRDGVIIDIVQHLVFLKMDSKLNCFVNTDTVMDAVGIYGSTTSVFYPIAGRQLNNTYEDISDWKFFDSIPEEVTPINYRYVDGGFKINYEYLPIGIAEAKTNSDAIVELYDMLIAMGGA